MAHNLPVSFRYETKMKTTPGIPGVVPFGAAVS